MSQTKAQLISDLVQALNFTGTASAPANGAFLSAANTLALATNSAQRLTIDSDGDVLVGLTTALSTQAGSIQAAGPILAKSFINSHTSNATVIEYISNVSKIRAYGATSGSGVLAFNTGGGGGSTDTERMRIGVNGNVYIGQTSGSEQLGVSGGTNSQTLSTNSTNSNGNMVQIKCSGTTKLFLGSAGSFITGASGITNQGIRAEGALLFAAGGHTERMRIDSSGNVGIGTASPVSDIHTSSSSDHIITHQSTTTGADIRMNFRDSGNTDKGGIHYLFNGNSLKFITAESERMRITSGGNVGIGTTSPSFSSFGSNTGGIEISDVNTNNALLVQSGSNEFFFANTSSENYIYGSSNAPLIFGTNNAARMRITPSGNVGIGTASPRQKLDVSGNIFASNSSQIQITGTASSKGLQLIGQDDGTSLIGTMGSSGEHLLFRTASSERMRLLVGGPHLLLGGTVSVNEITESAANAGIVIGGTGFGNAGLAIITSTSGTGRLYFGDDVGGNAGRNVGQINYGHSDNHMRFVTASTERMRIVSDGKVGIGLTTPDQLLHIYQQSGSSQAYLHVQNNRSRNAAIKFTTTQGSWLVGQGIGNDNDRFAIYDTAERFVLNSSGNVGIATASPAQKLDVNGTIKGARLLINTTAHHNSSRVNILGHTNNTSHTCFRCAKSDNNQLFLVRNDGAVIVDGSFSKGSGSFLIEHPLPSLAATKTLRHSFIEGPQCDNIYRGKVTLSSGTASINLDTVSKMTEGTFVVLNRDVQCFTSNETGWDAVKGSVTGNILTITCENNSSTDTISWMVVGERQDPNIKTSTITDDDGYLLVEEDKVAALEAA